MFAPPDVDYPLEPPAPVKSAKRWTAHFGPVGKRPRVISMFFRYVGAIEMAIQMEKCVFEAGCPYIPKVTQLVNAFRLNPNLLTGNYTPQVLVRLSDQTLSQGTVIEHMRIAREQQLDLERAVLTDQMEFDNDEKGRTTKKAIICRVCKSDDVDCNQKQTRGADEPMTVFCECLKCGTRWRM